MAGRADYRGLDRAEGGTISRFRAYSDALRATMWHTIFGSVYRVNKTQVLGVRAGDSGMLRTMNNQTGFVGIIRADFRPTGYPDTQTKLSQRATNPWGYGGDVPLDLHPASMRPAPWKRAVNGGNRRGTFTSGTVVNPHSRTWGSGT